MGTSFAVETVAELDQLCALLLSKPVYVMAKCKVQVGEHYEWNTRIRQFVATDFMVRLETGCEDVRRQLMQLFGEAHEQFRRGRKFFTKVFIFVIIFCLIKCHVAEHMMITFVFVSRLISTVQFVLGSSVLLLVKCMQGLAAVKMHFSRSTTRQSPAVMGPFLVRKTLLSACGQPSAASRVPYLVAFPTVSTENVVSLIKK